MDSISTWRVPTPASNGARRLDKAATSMTETNQESHAMPEGVGSGNGSKAPVVQPSTGRLSRCRSSGESSGAQVCNKHPSHHWVSSRARAFSSGLRSAKDGAADESTPNQRAMAPGPPRTWKFLAISSSTAASGRGLHVPSVGWLRCENTSSRRGIVAEKKTLRSEKSDHELIPCAMEAARTMA